MKYQNKLEIEFLNKIRPLGLDVAHGRTAPLGWPCGRLLSQPTSKQSPARHSPAGCRRAWSAGNGGVTAGSPAAEVHRQDYAEHEHLHAHSLGTYTTAGSSRDDETSEAATAHWRRGGSMGYNASLTSGTEGK
jgi:hypothetical protein